MRLESRASASPVLVFPLIAGALAGGCSGEAMTEANAAVAPAAPKAPSPAEAAERLVRQRLGAAEELRFSGVQVFDSAGATVVCGRVAQGGAGEQRYIAVGEDDLFVEGQMEPGHMDRAAQEFCRNA